MPRSLIAITSVAMLLLLGSGPAGAIVNGEPDADRHPYVGAIIIHNEFSSTKFCSGTLIAPTVFLTAAHCVPELLEFRDRLGYSISVTFDETPNTGIHKFPTMVPVASIYVHPAFDPELFTGGDEGDIAVLILDLANATDGFVLPEPAHLPATGLLDDLKAQGGLARRLFTVVGYGQDVEFGAGGPHDSFPTSRRTTVSRFAGLEHFLLGLLQNSDTGLGGICFGDSGGPTILGDGDVVVGVSSLLSDSFCRAIGYGYRLDTESAQSFLRQFVTLP